LPKLRLQRDIQRCQFCQSWVRHWQPDNARHVGDGNGALGFVLLARHRRRCTNAKGRAVLAETITQPPHQHRHVCSLATAIGVQLFENDEVETLRIFDDGLVEIVLPGHQQFKHHEIRQQDVGLGLPYPFTLVLVFLAALSQKSGSSDGDG
jgi:hypothetical protein